MAETTGRTRPDGRRVRVERPPGGPLGLAAARVRGLAAQLRDQQTTSDYLGALQQRRDQLDSVASSAEALVEVCRVLRSAGVRVPASPSLGPARQATLDLRQRYQGDPKSVRQPLTRNMDSPLEPTQAAFRHAWLEVASPSPGAVALAELLSRFPQFREVRGDIQRLCMQLTEVARTPPRSADDLARVTEWKEQLQQRIDTLEDDGLDADVQQFLRESATGVPLDRLLGKPGVLEFLEAHQLLSSLTVSFRTSATQVKR